MEDALLLPEAKKLTVIFRVEPGCLGPEGPKHIVEFCDFARKDLQTLDSDYVIWEILPRDDKSLPEVEFNAVGKRLTHTQAEKYLAVFGKSLEEFEGHLDDKLAELIDVFMGQ